ncbi:unnamed protein product [Arctogadus glacialis]
MEAPGVMRLHGSAAAWGRCACTTGVMSTLLPDIRRTGTRALFGVEWLQSSAIIAVYPGGSSRRTFRSSTPSAHQHQ